MPPQSVSEEEMSGAALRRKRGWILAALAALGVILAAGAIAIYAGVYNVAADIPHSQSVHWLLETAREQSIALRAADIAAPGDLSESRRIVSGAGQYAEMCASCHLAPGMKRTEISRGLYPRAPELRRKRQSTPAEDFWVVKHGIKMTGMPAWGVTHDDGLLWDIVAFLRKLPDLTPEEYQALVKSAPNTHDEMKHDVEMGNSHGHGE
jgi:mono/diheme cytochrome c family protein